MPHRIVRRGKTYEVWYYRGILDGKYIKERLYLKGATKEEAEELVRVLTINQRKRDRINAEKDRLAKLDLSPEEDSERINQFIYDNGLEYI